MARGNDRINMSFSAWLQAIGDEAASHLLGFSERTVRSWRLRERVPTFRSELRIISASRGAVTRGMLDLDKMAREACKS